ncbi:MAG: CYTH domain-containing protein [bacterium]
MQNFEIERKFLVKKLPPNLDRFPKLEIQQGYIAITHDGTEVRLRQKSSKFYQTVKNGEGLKRREVEIAITREQFGKLWPLTEGKRIEKVRYEIAHGAFTIELDIYRGALVGLLVAEVEFVSESESQSFMPPKWFGAEVTHDSRYKNKNLAVHGMPG